jgi:hypothetical protein
MARLVGNVAGCGNTVEKYRCEESVDEGVVTHRPTDPPSVHRHRPTDRPPDRPTARPTDRPLNPISSFRCIKLDNPTIRGKVAALPGSLELLRLTGFALRDG